MARALLLATLLLVPLVLCNPGCNVKCVGKGADCDLASDFGSCGDSGQLACDVCNSGTFCDPSDNICRPIASLGGSCTAPTDPSGAFCGTGTNKYYTYWPNDCNNNLCETSNSPYGPGESCTDALVNAVDSCVTGGCASGSGNTACPSIPQGQNCSSNPAQCAVGTYCNGTTGTCVPLGTPGTSCFVSAECVPTAGCLGGKCVAYLSGGVGSACGIPFGVGTPVTSSGGCGGGFGTASVADFVCQVGLFCATATALCAAPDLSDNGASCTAGSCTGDTTCYNTSTNCKLGPLKCLPTVLVANSKVANAYLSYLQCLQTNKCPGIPPFQGATNSNCAQKNCISAWKNYVNTLGGSSAVALTPAIGVLIAALFLLLN